MPLNRMPNRSPSKPATRVQPKRKISRDIDFLKKLGTVPKEHPGSLQAKKFLLLHCLDFAESVVMVGKEK